MNENSSSDSEINKEINERKNLLARPSRARYNKAHAVLDQRWKRRKLEADRMMREVVDVLWDHFGNNPYSWCGFYVLSADGAELKLGHHRDKPACSPLAMHGVCGRVALSGDAMRIDDVKTLGEAHIECDPRNVSELAVPVFNSAGKVWAVFDVDSEIQGAFNEMDQRWIEKILREFQKAV